MATLAELKSAIKSKLIAKTKDGMNFSDVVSIAQNMSPTEKQEFTRKILNPKADDPACKIISDRLNAQIETTAEGLTNALIDNDLTTMAELKTALGIV